MPVGPSLSLPAQPPVSLTAYGLTIGAIEVLALAFGVIWTFLNLYQYAPIGNAFVENAYSSVFGTTTPSERLDDADLPTIDVLLPAYEEGNVIEQSISSVRAANYPQDRLNLFVIVEPWDDDTRTVLSELTQYRFTELVVPEDYPGDPNKPRALNYAFEYTNGEIIGIVDAEDVVDPELFREAAREIAAGRDFVQARLDMVNERDGWLNTLFRAEYGFWYEIIMPAFQAVGYPLPLSGTSCLFRRSLLVVASVERREMYSDGVPRDGRLWTGTRRLFGWTPWDPTNVTEDFELGLFLWEQGFDVGYLEATTAEESPVSFDGWMRQRTRWKKGKIQTFYKYLRMPPDGIRAKTHLFWQSFLPHVGPINLVGVFLLIVVGNLAAFKLGLIVDVVLSLGLAFVVMSMAAFGVGYWRASDTPRLLRTRRFIIVVLTVPFYWLLQWAADVRALQQSYYGHFEWEHVTHYGRNVTAERSHAFEPETGHVFPIRAQFAALTIIVLVGASLRFVGLDTMSLWSDEIYSLTQRGAMSVPKMLVVANDPHPPLYFLLLHYWMDLVSDTPTAARVFSGLFSIATIPALFLLGRDLFDDRVGLVAAGMVSISTFHIHFGRIARMYSLFGLLTVLSWLYFVRLRTMSKRTAVGYLLATAAMLYTHAFGVFVLLAQHGYMALSETRAGIPRHRWLSVQTILALLAAPLFAYFSWQLVGPLFDLAASPAIDWIPIPSTIAVTQTFLAYLGYPSHYPVLADSRVLWVLAAGLLLAALGLVFLSSIYYTTEGGYQINASWQTGQLSMLLVVPIAVPFIVSYVYAPIYAPRYTFPASFGLYLLMAAGIVNTPTPRIRRIVLTVLLITSVPLIGGYYTTDSLEDWRGATASLEAHAQPDDLLVYQPGWIDYNVDYYYDGPALKSISVDRGSLSSTERSDLSDRFRRHERVWVISYQGPPSESLESTFEGRTRVVVFNRGYVYVVRYNKSE